MRAAMLGYDPYKQVKSRLKAFHAMRHPTDKIELIVMGGTFLAYPIKYQYNFIKRCYDALNNREAKNLEEAKKLNEKTAHRCVALCIETRPDVCGKKEIVRMLEFGATRAELGVQIIDDKIYSKIARGHTVADVVKATKMLKDSGFKVFYHLMLGLPGSNIKKDIQMFKKVFSDEKFKPDGIKIYPCQVIKGSELEKWYRQGKYKPYSEEELVELLIKLKTKVPKYCRIARVMREIPPDYLVAGTIHIDLRNTLEKEMLKRNLKCRCTRCREVGFALREGKKIDKKIKLKQITYRASGGKEIFLSYVNKDNILFGLCRVRIPTDKNALLIRDLPGFGPQERVGKISKIKEIPHKGLGKSLMREAERIAKQNRCKKIVVISGTGAREYYKKLGYVLEGHYMVKLLKN